MVGRSEFVRFEYFFISAPEQVDLNSIELTDSGTTYLQVSWSQAQATSHYEVALLNPLDDSQIQGIFTIQG